MRVVCAGQRGFGRFVLGSFAFLLCGLVAHPALAINVLTNPGFEEGTANGWFGFSGSNVAATAAEVNGGSFSGLSSGRVSSFDGPAQTVTGLVGAGKDHHISCWVRLANAPSATVRLWMRQTDGAGTNFIFFDQETVTDQEWTRLWWTFKPQLTGTLTDMTLFMDGPASNIDFYVDDCLVERFNWVAEANARIEAIRKDDMDVLVVDSLGNAIPGVSVDVDQVRHDFAFGGALQQNVLDIPIQQDFVIDHYEWATFEAEAKWNWNEPTQGVFDYLSADGMRDFCNQNGIKIHGHNIFWAPITWVQPWVQALNDAQLQLAMEDRLDDVVTRYKGDFVNWDVNNEMGHGSFYQDRLGPSIRPWMFQQAKILDPDARLFVNDFGIIAGNDTLPYIAQIEDLIASGAPIDGVGVQGHFFNNSVDPVLVVNRLDELSVLGLPVRVTEYDSIAADENIRAKNLEDLYRAAFSHPAVEGITMWGFWAETHWLGPDAAIVEVDWTLNAAGVRYETLLADWTTQDSGLSDGTGVFSYRGFHGTYDVTLTSGPIETLHTVSLLPSDSVISQPLALEPGSCVLAGEVGSLALSYNAGAAETTLAWSAPTAHPGMTVVYDVLLSADASDFGDPSTCVAEEQSATTAVDASGIATGEVEFFLVRAKNLCGLEGGDLGPATRGPRTAGSCG